MYKSINKKVAKFFEELKMVQTCLSYFYSTFSVFLIFSVLIWCLVSIKIVLGCIYKQRK